MALFSITKNNTIKLSKEEQKIGDEIKRLRKIVLVHSVIYYRMNTNIISDIQYDKFAKRLQSLQNQYPVISKSVNELYKEFKDWDGCSGFNLPLGDVWANNKAAYLLSLKGN